MSLTDIQIAAFDRVQQWTKQATEAVRHNGTLNNHLTSISSLAGSGEWQPVRVDGTKVDIDEDPRAQRFAESLLLTLDLERCVRRYETVGAHWLIPWPDDETLIRWDEASTAELLLPIDASRVPEIGRYPGIARVPLYPATLPMAKRPAVIRVWHPDDEYRDMAWSPVASVLQHIEALHLMDLAEMALDKNRLASAGLMLLPNDVAQIDPKNPTDSPVFNSIAKAAMTAIKDPNSAASVVPVFLTGPGDSLKNVRHLITERREDPQAFQARREAHLKEIARALSSPAGRVLGTEDQAKFANAAAMEADTLRTYLPAVTKAIVKAVNEVYAAVRQQWGMPTRGYKLRLSFESLQPAKVNRTAEAIQLREAGVITLDGVAEMADVPEDYRLKPGTPDYDMWQQSLKAKQPVQVAPMAPGESTVHAPNGKPPEGVPVPKPQKAAVQLPTLPTTLAELDAALGWTPPPTEAQIVAALGLETHQAMLTEPDYDPSTIITLRVANDDLEAAQGLPVDAQHMTIVYFGDLPSIGIADVCEAWAALVPPIDASVNSVGTLGDATVAFIGGAQPLVEYVVELRRMLRAQGIEWDSKYDFIPHVSLAYDTTFTPASDVQGAPVRFDRVEMTTVEGDTSSFPLTGVDGEHFPERQGSPAARLGASHVVTRVDPTAPNWRSIVPQLGGVDRTLYGQLSLVLEQRMKAFLTTTGNRAVNKASVEMKAKVASIPRTHAIAAMEAMKGTAVLAKLGLVEDELIDRSADGLAEEVGSFIDAAHAAAARMLIRTKSTYRATASMLADWRQAAIDRLVGGFKVAARTALHNPDPHALPENLHGEIPSNPTYLPGRVISDAVALAGGNEPTGPDSVLLGGPGQGDVLRSIIASSDNPPKLVYVWHHGYHGEPKTSFPPHEELDGMKFASAGDDGLVKSANAPFGGTVWSIGDHPFCRCAMVLEVDDGGQS